MLLLHRVLQKPVLRHAHDRFRRSWNENAKILERFELVLAQFRCCMLEEISADQDVRSAEGRHFALRECSRREAGLNHAGPRQTKPSRTQIMGRCAPAAAERYPTRRPNRIARQGPGRLGIFRPGGSGAASRTASGSLSGLWLHGDCHFLNRRRVFRTVRARRLGITSISVSR